MRRLRLVPGTFAQLRSTSSHLIQYAPAHTRCFSAGTAHSAKRTYKTQRFVRIGLLGMATFAGLTYTIKTDSDEPVIDKFAEARTRMFQNLKTGEVIRRFLVFEAVSHPGLVSAAKSLIDFANKLHLQILYRTICKYTFFSYFCGGEYSDEVLDTMHDLRQKNFNVILAYSVESDVPDASLEGKELDKKYDQTAEEVHRSTRKTIDIASQMPNNQVALKLSGLTNPAAMLRLNEILVGRNSQKHGVGKDELDFPKIIESYRNIIGEADYMRLRQLYYRSLELCSYAKDNRVGILIDAEQSYFQAVIDAIALDLCMKLNEPKKTCTVYTKIAPGILSKHLDLSQELRFSLGIKMVRGAYLFCEGEESRHLFHNTKEETDKSYDSMLLHLLATRAKQGSFNLLIASHNKYTIETALQLLKSHPPPKHIQVGFGQLYGMTDDLTYYLSEQLSAMRKEDPSRNYVIRKYLPYGKVEQVLPYLIRRADENCSMLDRAVDEKMAARGELMRRIGFGTTQT